MNPKLRRLRDFYLSVSKTRSGQHMQGTLQPLFVIPAQAGIQWLYRPWHWIPANPWPE
ncbi:MAG: hypothetical protein ABI132_06575 [Rhodanobacteraceae bacterium]